MIERTIKQRVIKSIKTRPVTLITGARQVGKSTLCKEIMKEYQFNYVTLDNLREKQLAMTDPEMFLKLHPWPLIIDEVQYAPKLFEVIESIVNQQKFESGVNYGMYLLTGSQTYQLMEGVSESLAGRVSVLEMLPLSVSEINNVPENPFKIDLDIIINRIKHYQISIEDLYNSIVKGFYPELYDNKEIEAIDYYSDYVQTYIERDVSQIIKLSNKLKFQNFMEILASLTGEEFVVDSISKAVGVDNKTIQSWISVLVSSDIIKLIQPYNEQSILKRVVKKPKLYFNDTGLACYLARLTDSKTLMVSAFNGRFVETYIINEIIKSYKNNGKKSNFFYYRDTAQNEIDLIILDDGVINLIECKSGISYNASSVKSFDKLKDTKYKLGLGCVICNTDKIYKIKDNVVALPISSI